MEFGLQLANLDWQRLRDVARAAEELGFGVLMLPDHIVYERIERDFDPEELSYDAMVRAAVILEATTTIRVGHLVLCNLFRHPVLTAQSLASLDTLGGGRVFAGVGSGWTESEFRMTGIRFPDIGTRLAMLDEALTCMRGLWTHERTTFAGQHYQLHDAILWPKPVQKPHPPILLGGGGRGLLRVAARHADVVNIVSETGKPGYISMDNIARLTDERFREKIRFLRTEAERAGRDPRTIAISSVVFSVAVTEDVAATRAAAESMAPLFDTTPEGVLRSPLTLIGTPEECVAELRRRRDAWELSQLVFAFSDEATMRRLATEVLPHV